MKNVAALVCVLSLILGGCLTRKDLSAISIGMTKQQVTRLLGKPKLVSAQGRAEYFTYETEASYFDGRVGGEFLYVRFVDGVVESFGQRGDFDSTKNPTLELVTRSTIDTTVHNVPGNDPDIETALRRLERLRRDGLITDSDYDAQKAHLLGAPNKP